jgi:CBS domain-containing protein
MGQGESSVKSRQKCRDIMTKNVRTATRDASLREVAVMMRDGDMGAVPIIDGARLVGVVTDRDIVVRAVSDGKGPDSPVSEAMTTELFTVKPDDFVFQAVRLMGDKQVRRVPVVNDDGSLAGIIAMADVALEMEDQQEIAETMEEISSGPAFWQKA